METIEEWAEYISELIFGPTPTEQLRRAKREIERAVRRVQNDKLTYDNKEKNAINQLKMKAKTAAAPSDLLPLAQDIARARAASARLHKIIMTMDGVQINLTANHSLATLSNATKMATDALKACNSITSAQNVQEYEKELMKFEVASDMFEDLSEQDGEKEDAALLLAQIADEQSIALQFELPGANCSRELCKTGNATQYSGPRAAWLALGTLALFCIILTRLSEQARRKGFDCLKRSCRQFQTKSRRSSIFSFPQEPR